MLQSRQFTNHPYLGIHKMNKDVLNDAYITNDNEYDCISMKSGRSIVSDDVSEAYEEMMEIKKFLTRFEGQSKTSMGVCYEPFHHKDYPTNIKKVLSEDFAIMKNYASIVRTYYSGYYGEPVVKYAKDAGMKIYLGIFLTDES